MSGTNPNPVQDGGPVITPPEQVTRNRLLFVGVLLIMAVAVLLFYLMPKRETGAEQQERLAAQQQQRDRPGDPGLPLRKPGFEDIPQPQPVTTDRPASTPAPPQPRYRPFIPAATMWTAPPPPAPPERTERTGRAVAPATAAAPAEAPQAKLAGLPVDRKSVRVGKECRSRWSP